MLRPACFRRSFAAPAMLATLLPSLVGPCLLPQELAAAIQPDPAPQEQYGPYQPYVGPYRVPQEQYEPYQPYSVYPAPQPQYEPYQPYRTNQPPQPYQGPRRYPQAPQEPEAPQSAHGRNFATVAEQYLLRAINAERRSRGLPAVHFTAELQEAAYRHAMNMARSNQLEHQLRGEQDLLHRGLSAGARFNKISENIGVGPSIPEMHVALMHSPHHRENILDDQVSEIGIAVIQVRGSFWAVEDFSDDAG